MERKLKCYFVEAKGHDEPNGVAVIAYTAKDAKKYAWSTLMEWIDWIDMRPTISKHANIEGLEEGHVFDCDTNKECWDALFRKVYASLYYVTCTRCKTEDTDVYELYEDVFCCENCEEGLTEKDVNNPYKLKMKGNKP